MLQDDLRRARQTSSGGPPKASQPNVKQPSAIDTLKAPGGRAHRRSATSAHVPSLSPLAENDASMASALDRASDTAPPSKPVDTSSATREQKRREEMIPKSQRHRRRESLQLLGKRIAAGRGEDDAASNLAAAAANSNPTNGSLPVIIADNPDGQSHRHSRKHSNPLDSENLLASGANDASLRSAGRFHLDKTPQLADGGLLFCGHCKGDELLVV